MSSFLPLPSHAGQRAGYSPNGQRPGPAGFALIIALILMGFILMLVLSLSSLVQTNIATSVVGQQATQAQRNALLGVQVAMGQLQQYAGKDQVATARADIKGQAVANPTWTGIWSEQAEQGEAPEFKLLTYLVSGNGASAGLLKYDETSGLVADRTAENSGILLSSAPNADGSDTMAKLVEIGSNGSEGGYAYWVSDESVKAKINLLPATNPTNPPENFGLTVPQMFGFPELKPWFDQSGLYKADDGSLDDAKVKSLGTVIDMGTLSAYKAGSAKDLSDDVTFYSYGVLSNPRTGGLKKDLTAAFDGNLDASLAGQKIISNKDNTPLWDQLYSWVQATPGNNDSLPVRAATNEQSGIYPVLLGFQLYMVPAYERVSDTEYKLYSYVVPTVALWNPYNYPLEMTSYNILAGRIQRGSGPDYVNDFAGDNLLQAYLIQTAIDATGANYETINYNDIDELRRTNALRKITNEYVNNGYVHNETLEFTIPDVTLAPGQIQIYSAGANQSFLTAGSDTRRELVEGSRALGFYIDLERQLTVDPSSTGTAFTQYRPILPYDNPGDPRLPTRVGALQLSINGGDVLSDAVYLNHVLSPSGYPSGFEIQQVPSGNQTELELRDVSSNTRAFGWLAVRNIGVDARYPLANHREVSVLDADYKWLANYNPRASTSGPHPISYRATKADYDSSTTANPSFVSLSDLRGDASDSVLHLVDTVRQRTSDGIILFEASPGISNIFSIGQLTHAPLFYWNDVHSGTTFSQTGTTRLRSRVENAGFDNLIPANPIGNSLANPAIPLAQTERSMNFGASESFQNFTNGTLYDYSYLLNQALWDDYFFSAVTTNGNDAQNNPIYSGSRNPRISLVPGKQSVQRGLETSAANLLIDGPFNVNSTSVNAWKALLSTFYGRTPGNADRISSVQASDAKTPIMRVSTSAVGAGDTNLGINSAETYSGYHTLSEEQINALANAIVDEIRRRGIAPSLSAFVNRSPSGDEASQLRGILSAAIKNAQLEGEQAINKGLSISSQESSEWRKVTVSGLQNAVAASGYITEGLPGWLTSADILSRLGSVLTSRGDTFLIRSYGEYGSGSDISKAWCEAVVQRLPEAVDEDESIAATDVSRRFVIVAFRWLSENEI